jgi:hypothetical protein
MAAQETLLAPPLRRVAALLTGSTAVPVAFAVPLAAAVRDAPAACAGDAHSCLAHWREQQGAERYVVQLSSKGVVQVLLQPGLDPAVQLRAYVQAIVLARLAAGAGSGGGGAARRQGGAWEELAGRCTAACLAWMDGNYERLVAALEGGGWEPGQLYLPQVVWTAAW